MLKIQTTHINSPSPCHKVDPDIMEVYDNTNAYSIEVTLLFTDIYYHCPQAVDLNAAI